MRVGVGVLCAVVTLLSATYGETRRGSNAEIRGVVTDRNDSRVANATVSVWGEGQNYQTQTGPDGTYSIRLKPGIYTMSVIQPGFCTFRRAAFLLQKNYRVEFNFRLWLCPCDAGEWYQYAELDPAPHTDLRPLVLFGENHYAGPLQIFTGAHEPGEFSEAGNHPVIFSFNLLTVQAERLTYDPHSHVLTATGTVVWQNGLENGTGPTLEIRVNGSSPTLIR